MSRVARSARVGSRQRTETLTDSKTIVLGESGELYLVDVGNALNVTLPEMQDGAYFKFLFIDDSTAGAVFAVSGATSSDTFRGRVVQTMHGPTNPNSAIVPQVTKSPDGTDFKLALAGGLGSGSMVEIFCNGSNWIIDAHITGAAATFS